MSVSFTRTALIVSLSVVKSAYYLYEPQTRHFENLDLGSDSPLHHENPLKCWSHLNQNKNIVTTYLLP